MTTTPEVQIGCDARTPGGAVQAPPTLAGGGAARPGPRPRAGPALMVGGALSNPGGAAAGALAFGVIAPAGVVAIRQWIAGIVLLAAGRPRWRAFTGAQWRAGLLLAGALGTMN